MLPGEEAETCVEQAGVGESGAAPRRAFTGRRQTDRDVADAITGSVVDGMINAIAREMRTFPCRGGAVARA
jgi:hypothetical protein